MLRTLRPLLLTLSTLACINALAAPAASSAAPASAAAQVALGTSCSPRSVQVVQAYVRDLMPQLAAVLLSSTLVEDVLGRLQEPARLAAWNSASPAVRQQVVESLSREAYALRDQVRQHVTNRLSELPWSEALKFECADYDKVARRMAQADAKSYFELEKLTLDVALGLGAHGVSAWLDLVSDAERSAARDEAVALSRNMPAYPFMFEGRAAFNALAVQGLRHADDARSAAWMSEVRRLMAGPGGTRFHKSAEAAQLRGIMTGGINDVVRSAYDATSRPALKADFERRALLSLKPLDASLTP